MMRPTPDILAQAGQGDVDAMAAAMGPQVMALDISAVRLDGGTQPRAGINQAVVEDYASDMEANGAEFPPVQVVYDGEAYWLWDGFHRLHARKRNGLYTVPAIVRQGTRRDAVLLSVGANAKHGFRRSSEDKRRAIDTLLRDTEWAQWSDREIARQVAVDHKTVSARRAALSGEIPQMDARRVGRKGVEYDMKLPQRPAVREPLTVEELVEELVALESVALDGVDEDWLFGYMTDLARRGGHTITRAVFDMAMRLAIPRQQRDNERTGRLLNARAAAMQADAERRDQPAGAPAASAAQEQARPQTDLGQEQQARSETGLSEESGPDADAVSETTGPQLPPLVFERKEMLRGKVVKLYGRCGDQGTITVTVDREKVHLYSPGVSMSVADMNRLREAIRYAIDAVFPVESAR